MESMVSIYIEPSHDVVSRAPHDRNRVNILSARSGASNSTLHFISCHYVSFVRRAWLSQ
jgi:hypothetical protein